MTMITAEERNTKKEEVEEEEEEKKKKKRRRQQEKQQEKTEEEEEEPKGENGSKVENGRAPCNLLQSPESPHAPKGQLAAPMSESDVPIIFSA
ncbi:uncharacterized protein BO97DRAFT_425666 [Aspergillus homomorphus CBS 101889]|uniref:Uncharacterized protein n=1 Tax=Aspergillus homomorphus (strain CBS 101889) TaxID=1450537 RepID=A0A395HVB7_ASPHC|nr:hypothetical protein BO97DRAFT_425666 [Aspergillus homomorphus CBS 101889]RAL11353.1 hypothetical protein BO97DRAFT_425666 [Aspergillus homomorphus CBS 101889]